MKIWVVAALLVAISRKRDKAAPRGQARGAEGWEGIVGARATSVTLLNAQGREDRHLRHPRPDPSKPDHGQFSMLEPRDTGRESQAAINQFD